MIISYNNYMSKKVGRIFGLIIVNTITLIRLIGAFLLPFIYHKYGSSSTSLFIIGLFLSDQIDGFLARTLKIPTFFGSIMDASSDKILNLISFIILGINHNIMFGPLIIEIAILYTIYSTYRYGGNIQSSFAGKVKTVILDICVIFCFILLSLPALKVNNNIINYLIDNTDNYILVLGIITLIAGLIALNDYVQKNKIARENPNCMSIKYEEKNRKPMSLIFKQLFDTKYYLKHKDESIMKQFYIQ